MLIRGVRTVDVAELALEALVDDLVLLRWGHPAGVLVVVLVDVGEERRERRAELEAELASVTQVVHPGELPANVGLVEVHRVMGVVRRGHGAGHSEGRAGAIGYLRGS